MQKLGARDHVRPPDDCLRSIHVHMLTQHNQEIDTDQRIQTLKKSFVRESREGLGPRH